MAVRFYEILSKRDNASVCNKIARELNKSYYALATKFAKLIPPQYITGLFRGKIPGKLSNLVANEIISKLNLKITVLPLRTRTGEQSKGLNASFAKHGFAIKIIAKPREPS